MNCLEFADPSTFGKYKDRYTFNQIIIFCELPSGEGEFFRVGQQCTSYQAFKGSCALFYDNYHGLTFKSCLSGSSLVNDECV